MKLKRPSFPKIKHPRRLFIIVASVIIGLGLIAYAVFSYFAWKNIEDYSKNAGTFLKQTINDELGAEKEGTTSEARVTSVLRKFRDEYSSTNCAANGLYAWQTVIPTVRQIQTACEQRATNVSTVTTTLENLVVFYDDQAKAVAVVSDALEATKTPTDYSNAQATWLATLDSPAVRNDAPSFAPVSQKIVVVAEELSAAYGDLLTASSSKKKATFDAAVTKLTAAYAHVGDIQAVADTEVQKLADIFLESYEAL